MTPLKSIRKFCIQCVGSAREVKKCGGHRMFGDDGDENGQCWFYKFRMGKGRPSVKRVRTHCLECMGGRYKLVAGCGDRGCPVHPFRMGRNPNYTQNRNRDQKDDKILFESAA
jgi:hypothetical protein